MRDIFAIFTSLNKRLGYQYDWSARKYIAEQFVPFPVKLAALCSEIAGLVGEEHSLKPDAAIVNFYPVIILPRHLFSSSPLFSFSSSSSVSFLLASLTSLVTTLLIVMIDVINSKPSTTLNDHCYVFRNYELMK